MTDKPTLYTHQSEGATWLASHPRAYLADDCGLGKTATLLAALQLRGVRHPFVVCPAKVRDHWENEFARWAPGLPHTVLSFDRIRSGGMELMAQMVRTVGVDALVVDEAHLTKNVLARRTKLLLGPDGYARRVPVTWLASGTPMPKNPGELAPALFALAPEAARADGIRSVSDYESAFCHVEWRPPPIGHKILPTLKNPSRWAALVKPWILRRTVADIGLDVPGIWWQRLTLTAATHAGLTADEQLAADLVLSMTDGELAQLATDPSVSRLRRKLGVAKAAVTGEWIAEFLRDHPMEKVVVFAHHLDVLDILRAELVDFGVAYVGGKTANSAEAIARFQSDPNTRVFLGQNIACMTGITLHAASHVVLVEPDWTGAVNVQLARRLARIGQKNNHVICHMVALGGTLDDAIVAQNVRETKFAADVFGADGVLR